MRAIFIFIFLGLGLMSGCASTPEGAATLAKTGKPQTVINSTDLNKIRTAIIVVMQHQGYTVEKGDDVGLTMSRPDRFVRPVEQSARDQAPKAQSLRETVYTFLSTGNGTRVIANPYSVYQGVDGSRSRSPLKEEWRLKEYQRQLEKVKKMVERG